MRMHYIGLEFSQRSLDFTAHLVGSLTQAAEKNHLKSEPLQNQLERLKEIYPKNVGEKTPSKDKDPFAN